MGWFKRKNKKPKRYEAYPGQGGWMEKLGLESEARLFVLMLYVAMFLAFLQLVFGWEIA